MEENTIFVNLYPADIQKFPVNEKEVFRYAGYLGSPRDAEEQLKQVFEETIQEALKTLTYKVCYRRVCIEWKDGMPVLPFPSDSKELAKCLQGSQEVVIFAATIGLSIDRLIARYQRVSPLKALILQAFGAERVEALCDVFCEEIREKAMEQHLFTTPRFSPGYGDLPLEKQVDFFRLLDCNRKIGVSLNDSLLMTPSKSVTAIFGIGECVGPKRQHKCEVCDNTDCEFRAQILRGADNDGGMK